MMGTLAGVDVPGDHLLSPGGRAGAHRARIPRPCTAESRWEHAVMVIDGDLDVHASTTAGDATCDAPDAQRPVLPRRRPRPTS